MTVSTSVGTLLASGVERLRAVPGAGSSPGNASLEAGVLLAHALRTTRAALMSHEERLVEAAAAQRYRALLERRARGEPLAYLLGTREFWSLPLQVTPAVLVPRPETELLVERALALCSRPQARVADLGTGSGAVALALAHERPQWRLTATDLSPEALTVARANAARLAIGRIDFRHGSWFEPLAGERFDLIVSNPPYIAADDPALDDPALAHEPPLALTPGADGLACLRTIAADAPQHLHAGGWLLLEHGATQGATLRAALVLAGWRYVRSHRDLAGHERITEGRYDPI
ncbi:MAG: peptide chain release factor N(5)-glutamine methyltransferase [Gammaproteobacteria bacterium]|nr:peptide chain release factor N(5)-glutamine methyltransferase [Gammaproteobacteria bacterium]